jgi:myo-inositol-1-phosphate synthase
MDYLYGEMQSEEKKALEAHVKVCATCLEKKQEFGGTMETLDAWRVEVPRKVSLKAGVNRFQPVVKWAAAAALLVTTGFAAARFSQPPVDIAAITAEVTEQVTVRVQDPLEARMKEASEAAAELAVANAREKLEMEVAARIQEISLRAQTEAMLAMREELEEITADVTAMRDEDRKRLNQVLKTFETQWLAEYRKMREDLERVALFSDESFRKAQRQLVQLASYNQPAMESLDGKENEQ